jgi:hypothetical protein
MKDDTINCKAYITKTIKYHVISFHPRPKKYYGNFFGEIRCIRKYKFIAVEGKLG